MNKRKAQPRSTIDGEEAQWKEDLGVNYTVDNFGIIDDSDSGNEVHCCILPKHGTPGGPVEPEETQRESNQVRQRYRQSRKKMKGGKKLR